MNASALTSSRDLMPSCCGGLQRFQKRFDEIVSVFKKFVRVYMHIFQYGKAVEGVAFGSSRTRESEILGSVERCRSHEVYCTVCVSLSVLCMSDAPRP